MSYAKQSLLGGVQVIQSVLQPEIRAKVLTFLGKTYYRTIAPAHVKILTGRELILIREEERRGAVDKYGGTWDYIPLSRIVAMSRSARDGDSAVLAIELPGGAQLECLFQAPAEREIGELLDRFREMAAEGFASRVPLLNDGAGFLVGRASSGTN